MLTFGAFKTIFIVSSHRYMEKYYIPHTCKSIYTIYVILYVKNY